MAQSKPARVSFRQVLKLVELLAPKERKRLLQEMKLKERQSETTIHDEQSQHGEKDYAERVPQESQDKHKICMSGNKSSKIIDFGPTMTPKEILEFLSGWAISTECSTQEEWEKLKHVLDEDRLSTRHLFDEHNYSS